MVPCTPRTTCDPQLETPLKKRISAVLVPAILAAIFAAGCGGDDKKSTGDPNAPAPQISKKGSGDGKGPVTPPAPPPPPPLPGK
jgi:hypothetical protein